MRTRRSASATKERAASKSGEGSWRERIAEAFDRMSGNHRKVASFLLEHPTEAAFMTGLQLAKHIDVDPATIVRFAQSLGYAGYPELSADVQASVRGLFEAAREIKEPAGSATAGAWQGSLLASAALIENLAGAAVWKDARRLIKILSAAQEVLVVADSADRILAEWLTHNLRSAGLRAMTVDADPRSSQALVAGLHAGDVLVGVAVVADGKAVAGVLRGAAARGARTVSLATGAASPAGLASEVTLTCLAGESAAAGVPGNRGSVTFAAIVESLRRALTANGAEP